MVWHFQHGASQIGSLHDELKFSLLSDVGSEQEADFVPGQLQHYPIVVDVAASALEKLRWRVEYFNRDCLCNVTPVFQAQLCR